MSIIKHFNCFLFAFFIFGVAPLHSEVVNKNVKTKRNFVPVTISSILIVSASGFLLYCNYLAELGQINIIVNCFSLLSGLTFCLSAISQCWFLPSAYQKLIYQIIETQSILEKKLSENLSLSPFSNRYKRKVVLLCLLLSASSTSAAIALWKLIKINGVLFCGLQSLISGFSGLIVAHSILYIDIVEMLFGVLNQQIRNSPVPLYSQKKIEFLKYVKLMHMNLWKVMVQINDFFSWSLLFFTINYVIYMVYDMYFLFHTLQVEWNALDVSGKKIFVVD